MGLIQAARVAPAVSSTLLSTTQNEEMTAAWTSGEVITLTTVGSGVLVGTLIVNFQQKTLVRGVDYTFTGPNTITLLFDFDPTVYDPPEVLIQISYAYYA